MSEGEEEAEVEEEDVVVDWAREIVRSAALLALI